VHAVGASFVYLASNDEIDHTGRSSSPRSSALGLASTLRIMDLVLREGVTLLPFSCSP
jgi:hypothetical protein